MNPRRFTGAVLLSFSLFASPAHAEATDATAVAEAIFQDARQLMADGRYAEACPKLAESERLDPGVGTLLNLGECYEKNGQIASAWATYTEAASAAHAAQQTARENHAREKAAALAPRLSRMEIRVAPRAAVTPGIVVRLDDRELGPAAWSAPFPIDAGAHRIRASAPGKKPWSTEKAVADTEPIVVVVPELVDEPVASRPSEGRAMEGPHRRRSLGFVLGGVGIAAIATGGVFGLFAASKKSDAGCDDAFCTHPDKIHAANTDANVANVAVAIGGAALVSGIVFVLTDRPRPPKTSTVRLGASVGIGGLSVGGRW